MNVAVAVRRSAAVSRNRWIGLDSVGNDDWLLLLLLLQLLQVRILCETRNWVVGGSEWRRRNQRWGDNFFRKRMKSRMKRIVLHRTWPVPAATSAAVAPTNWSELNQRTAHLLLMILLPDLLMDKCQRRNNSAIHGSHEIRVIGDWVVSSWHHGDVVNSDSGRLHSRQNGQLDAAQKDEKGQTANEGTAETAVRILLVLYDGKKRFQQKLSTLKIIK